MRIGDRAQLLDGCAEHGSVDTESDGVVFGAVRDVGQLDNVRAGEGRRRDAVCTTAIK